MLCRASKFTRLYLTVKAFDGWTRDPWLELEFFLHVKWRKRYGSVHLVNCSKTKINKVTEDRSWFSQGKIVSVQRVCSVELNHRGKINWVVQNLSAVCEVPISKKFFAWKNNLKRLSRHSDQESVQNYGNIKDNHFVTIYVYTSSKDKVLCWNTKPKGI